MRLSINLRFSYVSEPVTRKDLHQQTVIGTEKKRRQAHKFLTPLLKTESALGSTRNQLKLKFWWG